VSREREKGRIILKIIFMGTPDFAVKSLSKLFKDGHIILAVFSGADKVRGRGKTLSFSPVKQFAVSNNIPVYEPSEMTAELISELRADLIAVVAYGRLLTQEILDIPPLGCINIHGSLLPKYRGAAPVQHAVLNGDAITGVTSMYMAKEMDSGDIIYTNETAILPDETSEDLFNRLSVMGAQLLSKTVLDISAGTAPRRAQDHQNATYAPMLTKDMARIDFSKSAKEIKCKVRALVPWPVAEAEIAGKLFKIYCVDITDNKINEPCGTVITDNKTKIEVVAGEGTVIIEKLQAAGGKILTASEFLRGNKLK